MPNLITFFILFLLPFVVAPFGVTQFENPKVIAAEIGIIILFIVSLTLDKIKIVVNKQKIYLYLSLALLTLISAIYNPSKEMLTGNAVRMQGIFLLWFLVLFSTLSGKFSFKNIPAPVFFILIISQLIFMIIFSVNESHRFIGTLGEPNATAAFIIFLWPFYFFSAKKTNLENKLMTPIAVVVTLLMLWLTNSKSALVAFAIQWLFIFFKKIRLSTIKSAILSLVFYLTGYFLPLFGHSVYENRTQIWQSALFANGKKFLFGQGFGNMEVALHSSAQRLNLLIQNSFFDSAHNIFLDWWVQGGLLGFVVVITLVYLTLRRFIIDDNQRELVLSIGLITALSFNPASVVGLLGFWWLIGQGLKTDSGAGERT